jgi:excisionase family DNA binding protein
MQCKTTDCQDLSRKLLTVQEVADVLNVSTRMVWRLIAETELEKVSVGRCCRISVASLEAYIAKGGSR